MLLTLRPLFLVLFLLLTFSLHAQSTPGPGCKPIKQRELWHDRIDREQKNILRADGKADEIFVASRDEEINFLATRSLVEKIDRLQCLVESDTVLKAQVKVAYLTGIEKLLKTFQSSFRARRIAGSNLPTLIEAFEKAILLDKQGVSILPVVEANIYEIGNLVVSTEIFKSNPGYKASRNLLVLKYGEQYPDKILYTLKSNPDVPFRDSLILIAAYKYPRQLYDYAAANNNLGYAIRKIDDPLVKTISKMATSKGSGQLYFPFLDNIVKGKQTFEDIDAVKGDDVKYYKLLVKTRVDYVYRMQQKEQVFEMESLNWWLKKKANEYFVKRINELHNEPDAKRFQILQQLNAQELYYLIVNTESEIYTSSYVRGVYPLVMQRVGNRGDSLLQMVNFDRFKKFIKMAAGFNTLSHFLNSFPKNGEADLLMTAFVNGLEKSEGLEDGVDVADSYASIHETIPPIADEMLRNVKLNYEKNLSQNNKRGMVIYNILYKLFLSADTTKTVDLTSEFGIPPVYNVNYSSLVTPDSTQTAIMSMFFFGDKDGKDDYNDFIQQFSNANWKKNDAKQWVVFTSVKGKPVSIFANKPFDEESGEDEKAQVAMTAWQLEKGLSPTIVVHRGHSYYAESTIEHIQPTAKIVFLGSCGGYHLIHDVLSHSGDAHIIASKQIGKRIINRPFLELLTDKLRGGQNVDWIPFWSEFSQKAGKVDGFADYIPPHKNLGAIFIKAYKSQMMQNES